MVDISTSSVISTTANVDPSTQDTVDLILSIFDDISQQTVTVLNDKNAQINTLTAANTTLTGEYQKALTQDSADQASLQAANDKIVGLQAQIQASQSDLANEQKLLANLQAFKSTLANTITTTANGNTVSNISNPSVNNTTTAVSNTSGNTSDQGTTTATTGSTVAPVQNA
jgi:hypothetical protein